MSALAANAAMAAENGVSMRFYRNMFPRSLKALEAFDRDGVAPDLAVTLPDFRLRDPWTLSRTKGISRCCGVILDATLKMPESGEFRLVVPQGGGQRRLFSVRSGGSLNELALKAAEVAGMPQYIDQNGKKSPEKALATEPLEMAAGESIRLRAFFATNWREDRFFVGLVTNGVFVSIPKDCLVPSAPASTRPRLAVGNPASAPTPDLDDDEPGSLSWESLSQDRAFIGHFLDWAATNPPPKGASKYPKAMPSKYPFIRARLAEVALSANQSIWCNTNFVKGAGCVALKGPPYHYHSGSSASFEFDVVNEGDYRLWCRYWRPGKKFSGTFNVSVSCAPSGNPAADGLDVFTSELAQTFARTPSCPYRPLDPIPDIRSTPYPPDGWAWEGSHKLAHLKPGCYRVTFTTGAYPDQPGAVVSDVLLTADPMLDPAVTETISAPDASAPSKDTGISHGVLLASPDSRNPLLAMRPLRGTKASPAVRDWWRRWRDALFDKLCDAEYSDYVWGYLATLNYFDEDSNLIGRVREVRAQRTADLGATVHDKVGDGDLAFWVQGPFAPFTRFSPPSSGWREGNGGTSVWTPLAAEKIGLTEHEAAAMSGEVKSLMLLVRNNTDEARVIEPVVESKLPAMVRLVAYTVTGAGFWSPQILLKRQKVVCPPHQNTALWLTVDCREAAEGEFPVTLRFADRAVVWRVKVEGSISAAPTPITYGWSRPYARKSCWETYRDYGINAISYMSVSRRVMDEYGIKLLVGIPHGNIGPNAAGSNEVRRVIERAERLGQRPEEYCWYLIDEPHTAHIPQWTAMAQTIKGVDERQQIWCNLGDGVVRPEHGDLYFKMMEYWDVACPFLWQFGSKKTFPRYYEKLRETGRIKLLYHTLDIGSTEKRPQACWDILGLADAAIREGRDGFANFTLMSGAPYDDLYIDNEDLAVSIYPGANGRTLSTRNLEAWREGVQRWRKAKLKQQKAKE